MKDRARDWGKFALLLIDVQNDFWSKETARHFPDFPGNITRLLTFCRSEGLEVVHLRARFRPDMSDWMPMYKLRGRIPCVEGTAGAELLAFARERRGETVMIKQAYDGFLDTPLLGYLRRKGKRFVLTAGLVTSICVLLTTASATQLGFLTAIVEDCCADEPQAHDFALERYSFAFDRTTLELIPQHYPEWLEWIAELDRIDAALP